MPRVYFASGITGAGSAPFPGGPALVTDLDVGVETIGLGSHLFPTGPNFRVQHVGWVGLAFTPPHVGVFIGAPTIEMAWWEYIDFALFDKVVGYKYPFVVDTFVWNLAAGCSITVDVTA